MIDHGKQIRIKAATGILTEQEILSFIQEGGNLQWKSTNGKTALHWAIFRDNKDTARNLVKYGALLFIKDLEQKCPLDYVKDAAFKRQLIMLYFTKDLDKIHKNAYSDFFAYQKAVTDKAITLYNGILQQTSSDIAHDNLRLIMETLQTLFLQYGVSIKLTLTLTNNFEEVDNPQITSPCSIEP